MADVVLRHGPLVTGQNCKTRFAAHSENVGQLGERDPNELVVRVGQELALKRPSKKSPQHAASLRSAAGEFAAGEGDGQNPPTLDGGHDEAGGVERMRDIG